MKTTKSLLLTISVLALLFILNGCLIQNPKPEECEVIEMMVAEIYEGGVKDIVFARENGDFYYINRGLEMGYTLEGMEEKVLNKKVTLHLANTLIGTSNHIAQLVIEDEVVFSEFATSE